jgi:glutathione synthase/RimK-type ligase-like ATP-grasp enzyme
VSCAFARERDDDLDPTIEALSRHGREGVVVFWDDPEADWSSFEAAVIRSPWDYHFRYTEFLGWLDHVSGQTRVLNDPGMLRWNTDKSYLAELAAVGVPVIPTVLLAPDRAVLAEELPRMLGEIGDDLVVKPTVSAGSNNTHRRVGDPGAAAADVRALHELGKTAMVQPYQHRIDTEGEIGLVFFDGRFSHAFRKAPLLVGDAARNHLFAEEIITSHDASDELVAFGETVVAAVTERFGEPPLYARVDTVPGDDETLLIELEATEPSLFLHTSDGAADRFAAAVCARARG